MASPQMKAAKQAAQIERRGDTLTMEDGTTIKAIPDTNPESIRNAAPQDIVDANGGANLCVFYMTMAGYKTYMKNEGQTITRGGIKWTIEGPARNQSYSDVSLVISVVASSSGNPA